MLGRVRTEELALVAESAAHRQESRVYKPRIKSRHSAASLQLTVLSGVHFKRRSLRGSLVIWRQMRRLFFFLFFFFSNTVYRPFIEFVRSYRFFVFKLDFL